MKQTAFVLFMTTAILFSALLCGCGDGGSDTDGDTENEPETSDGDTDSYSPDGDYENGNAESDADGESGISRFECSEANGQSFCRDVESGIIWQNKTTDELYSWSEAGQYCSDLQWAGYSDWRLPSISEMRWIIFGCADTQINGACNVKDSCLTTSCLNSACAGCEAGHCYWDNNIQAPCDHSHWSGSTVTDSQGTAWITGFYNGGINSELKTERNYALCVRAESADGDIDSNEIDPEEDAEPEVESPEESEEDQAENDDGSEADTEPGNMACEAVNSDEVCTASASGLEWQNPAHNVSLSWIDAVDYCDGLNYAQHGDWRLPSISELRSLIVNCSDTVSGGECEVSDACPNYTCMSADCNGCPDKSDDCYWDSQLHGDCGVNYWSSTETPEETSEAWFVGFYCAALNTDGKNELGGVRCVRKD